MIKDGLVARKEELTTTLGEITLINCPIVDCPTHTNQTNQSDSIPRLRPRKNSKPARHQESRAICNRTSDRDKGGNQRLLITTDVADIESELKPKGLIVEKIPSLRRFVTKAPLPLFMVELKRSDGAEKIYAIKNLNYLTMSVRRKPA
ncbi:hypothetical protein TNCV_1232111 [Trichonephila clavipes]|nr:hypothetical protein TNCV_1232111 [Trichonephila clavipes]